MKRSFLTSILFLFLCTLCVLLLSHCSKEGKGPSPALAPDFRLKTLDNREITVSKLKGKVILLDFWATWCAPCRESIPHLVQLHKTYQKEGLEVIGMNVDQGDIGTVRRFVKSIDIPYPIAIAPEDVSRKYAVNAIPTTVLIDKAGKVRQRFLGFSPEISKQMTATVTELTSEEP